MSTLKKRLSFLMTMILIVSFPLSSIVFAEGSNSGSDPIIICQTYTKNMNSVQKDEVQIVINSNGTATVFFETTMNCVEATFSDYTYDGSPLPYENQVLFSSETLRVDAPGKQSITIPLPPCGPSQLDFYLGPVQNQLKPTGHDFLIKYAFQEATGCTTPTPTPTATPTPTPTSTTPETPTPTPTSTTPETPTPTPTSTTPETPTPTPTSTTPETPSPTPTSTAPETPSPTPSSTPSSSPSVPPSESPPPTETATTPPSAPPSESPPESPEPSETTIIIEDEEVPLGDGPNEVDKSTSESIPPIDTLPKTGDASPIPYYLLGSFVIVSGLITLRSRKRQNE